MRRLLTLLLILSAGCGPTTGDSDSPDSAPPPAHPDDPYRQEIDAGGTGKKEYGPYAGIDGRRVKGTRRANAREQGKYLYGLEDDQGHTLLPAIHPELAVIPGICVLFRPAPGKEIVRLDLRDMNRRPLPNIVQLEWAVRHDPEGPRHAVLYRRPSGLSALDKIGLDDPDEFNSLQMAVINGRGGVDAHWSGLTTFKDTSVPFKRSGSYSLIAFDAPDASELNQLLDDRLMPAGGPVARAIEYFQDAEPAGDRITLLLSPSPLDPTLWHALQPDGTFGAPPGCVGMIPLLSNGSDGQRFLSEHYADSLRHPRLASCFGWLLAYPNREGSYDWGWLDPKTGVPSGPAWSQIRTEHTQASMTAEIRYTGVLLGRRIGGDWELMLPTLPPRVLQKGPDVSELLIAHEKWAVERSKEKKAAEEVMDRWRAENLRRSKVKDFEEALGRRDVVALRSLVNGLDDSYFLRYVDADPTEANLQRAASMTRDPEKKKDYLDRAAKLAKARQEKLEKFRQAMEARRLAEQTAKAAERVVPPYGGNSATFDNYYQQSQDNAARLQALQNYTYGRTDRVYGGPWNSRRW